MVDSKKQAFPGQRLTVEEEYTAGTNTYVDDEGNVVASSPGTILFDEDGREVHVDANRKPSKGVEVGTIVVGRVALVKDAVAILNIGYAEKDGVRTNVFDSSAVLGVARVAREFIRSMKDHFKVGDFVRAKVTAVTPYSVEVSTAEKGLGVIASRDTIIKTTIMGKEVFPDVKPQEGE